jgi:hypothetical protein
MFLKRGGVMSKRASSNSRKDFIVAVRMPHSLTEELKDIQKINHFMDISDEIRYVVRKYCIQPKPPELEKAFLENKRKEKLIEELNNIIEQLKITQK